MNTHTLLPLVVVWLVVMYQPNLGPNSNPFQPPPQNPQTQSIHPQR